MAEEQGIHVKSTGDSRAAVASLNKLNVRLDALEERLRNYQNTTRKTASATELFERALVDVRSTSHSTTSAIKNLDYSMLGAASAASESGQRLSWFGRISRAVRNQSQAVSYQIQDVAVQMAAGTSATTALGQNMPQLLSAFGSLGAVLGVVAAVGFPVFGLLTSMSGEAKTTEEAIEDLAKAIEAYNSALENASKSTASLSAEFGTAAPLAQKLYERLLKIAELDLTKNLETSEGKFLRFFHGGGKTLAAYASAQELFKFDVPVTFSADAETRRANRALVDDMMAEYNKVINSAPGSDAQLQAADRLIEKFTALAELSGDISADEKEILDLLTRQFAPLLELRAIQEQIAADKKEAANEEQRALQARIQAEVDALERARQAQEKYANSRSASFEEEQRKTVEYYNRLEQEQAQYANLRLTKAAEMADAERMLGEQMMQVISDKEAETKESINRVQEAFSSAMKNLREQDIARTEAALDSLFRTRTLYYRLEYAGEAEVMSQPVAPVGGNPAQDTPVKDLVKLGFTPEYLRDVLGRDISSLEGYGGGGGGGGSKKDPYAEMKNELQRLEESFATKKELVVAQYDEEQKLLQEALNARVIEQQKFQDLSLKSTEAYMEARKQLAHEEQQTMLGHYGTLFGNLSSVFEAGGKRMVGISKAFSVAQGLLNSYRAYTEVLADPSLLGRPLLRQALAASTLASGLAQVANMRSVNYGSGGGGGGGRASSGVGAVAATETASSQPLDVRLQGFGPQDLVTGSMISALFDRLNEEAGDRGIRLSFAS
jgi:ABC-type transporter Mla subunit MlaD